MKKATLAVLGALVLLTATSCGGDSSAPEQSAIATNIAKAIATDDGLLDSEQADCVATKFVDDLGEKKLKESKVVSDGGTYNDNGATVNPTTTAAYAKAVLACVDKGEATEKIEKTLIAGSAGATIPESNAACYVDKLVKSVDLEHLLSSRIITDSGELSQDAAAPDEDTASKSTAALLACVDYYALDGKERAKQTKGLKASTYTACLRKRLSKDLLARFLTAVQLQSGDLRTLSTEVNEFTTTCTTAATK